MDSYEKLLERLDGYQKELDELWASYNPDDPTLKIELIGLKMSNLYWRYLVEIFQLANDGLVDLLIARLRKSLTAFTYLLTGSTLFINPKITPAAVLGSIYLTLQNKKDDRRMNKLLSDEQMMVLYDKIDYLEEVYTEKTDAIFDRTMDFEDEELLSQLEEPEKTKRFVGNKLMKAIKDEGKLDIEEKYFDVLRDIIQTSLNTDESNLKSLVKRADKEYNRQVKDSVKLNKKDAKLERVNRFLIR